MQINIHAKLRLAALIVLGGLTAWVVLASHLSLPSFNLNDNDKVVAMLLAIIGVLALGHCLLIRRDLALFALVSQSEMKHKAHLEQQNQERTHALAQSSSALALSEARLRGIFESALVAILTADEAQVITLANPAAAKMFACSMDELIGSPLARFVPERFREKHEHQVQTFGDGNREGNKEDHGEGHPRSKGLRHEVMGLRANGDEFPLEAAISYFQTAGKRFYTVILKDITQRHRAEQALLASKAKLDAALNSMSDAVLIVDAEGNFIEFNEACATFHRFNSKTGCCQTLAQYQALFDVFMANGEPAALDQWALTRALRGETATGVEYHVKRKDGAETWIGSYSFAPIRLPAGEIVGAVVSSRDVTTVKQAQVDLENSHADLQRLIAAQDHVQENERSRIARELHDDLQQMWAVIRMDAVAIGERLAVVPPDVAALLARIDKVAASAITSTRRIVNDLRPLMLEDLGLVAALESLIRQFGEHTGLEAQLVAPLEAQDEIEEALQATPASATCLFRVAQESLNNVFKHARASKVLVQLTSTPDGAVVLRISDDGRGIPMGHKRSPQSFGLLGMHERVRALGGMVRINSTPGEGTTVEVVLHLKRR